MKHLSRSALIGIAVFVLVGILVVANSPVALTANPPNQPFDLIYTAMNVKYRIYQDGVGMLGKTEGTLTPPTFNSPGIVKAYLVWAGLGRDDNGVLLRRDAGANTLIMPDYTWNRDTYGGQDTWGCCGGELTVYAADITGTGIVQPGTHNYTVSDMAISHIRNNRTVEENWGYSLIVVYQDPSLPQARDIYIKLGNDGLFAGWTGLIGPNSDVQCLAFDPAPVERRANFSVVVGGVESAERPNALWGLAGSEAYLDQPVQGGTWNQSAGLIHLPPNIVGIGGVGGQQLDGPFPGDSIFPPPPPDDGPPFADRNGDEWDDYQRFDIPIDAGDTWACVQVESATQANRPDLPPVGPGTTNRSASIGFLGFIIVLEQVAPAPAIDIVKYTNGQDANDPNGSGVPVVAPGGTVTWTYEVTNIGTIDIPEADITVTDSVEGTITQIVDKGDGNAILAPQESWLYQAVGTALNLASPPADPGLVLVPDVCTQGNAANQPSTAYTNIGTVTIPSMNAEDPSSYCNPQGEPLIDIIKYTNGQDANDPDGADVPIIVAGDVVSWTYEVTNIGTVDIPEADITVTDNVEGVVTQIVDKGDGDAVLAPAEAWLYQVVGTAINLTSPPTDPGLVLVPDVCTQGNAANQPSTAYTNIGTVTIPSTSATDPSSYCNPQGEPLIDIIKYTNGQDANDPNGPGVPVIAPGATVTWTYEVTNVGTVDIPEADITVTDNVEGVVTQIVDKGDGDAVLAPAEAWLYQVVGTAINLTSPPTDPGLVLVPDVCTQGNAANQPSTAYTNIGTVTIPSTSATDPSSYCNPLQEPAINIIKYTEGGDTTTPADANDPDGVDVPVIRATFTVTWTYHVTNIGPIDIPETDITVTDSVEGDVTDIIDRGQDGDAVLEPGDTWIYQKVGTAIDLTAPPDIPGLVIVENVCTQGGILLPPYRAYTNVGTVTIPTMSATDPSSYCGPKPDAIDDPDAPDRPQDGVQIFMPLVR